MVVVVVEVLRPVGWQAALSSGFLPLLSISGVRCLILRIEHGHNNITSLPSPPLSPQFNIIT